MPGASALGQPAATPGRPGRVGGVLVPGGPGSAVGPCRRPQHGRARLRRAVVAARRWYTVGGTSHGWSTRPGAGADLAPVAVAVWSAAVLGGGFGFGVLSGIACAVAAGAVNLAGVRPTGVTPGRAAASIAAGGRWSS
jgi:hypothetical protein